MRPLTDAELGAYLERVGVDRAGADPVAIHRAHLLAVPFENFDVHLGTPISLDVGRIVDKLVARRRGGFCYEHNLLHAAALTALGHRVALLEARMFDADEDRFGVPFDHLALEVDLGGRPHLADVGSGRGFLEPLPMDGEEVAGFRVVPDGDAMLLLAGGGPRYRFDRTPREAADFEAGATYHQTSPDSPFTKGWVCTLRLPGDGRVTVAGGVLVETTPAGRTERPLDGPDELAGILQERFGLPPLRVPAWAAA